MELKNAVFIINELNETCWRNIFFIFQLFKFFGVKNCTNFLLHFWFYLANTFKVKSPQHLELVRFLSA